MVGIPHIGPITTCETCGNGVVCQCAIPRIPFLPQGSIPTIADFKAAKAAKAQPLISRRRANLAAGTLLTVLAECESNDLMATLRFDMTPDDLTAIESFIFHLQHRIEDRING